MRKRLIFALSNRRRVGIALPLLVTVLAIVPTLRRVGAQDEPRGLKTIPAGAEKRIALVIGNASYPIGPLANPVNDARDMAAALRVVRFEVTLREDLTQRQMKEEIQAFGRALRAGGVGLFYYAGHGLQVGGRNYLVPIDAKIEREEDVEFEAVDAGRVLAELAKAENNLNIIILDACRNNPFARSFRSAAQGLAYMSAPSGTLIAYATAPGAVASDGRGRNGLYTEELLKNMRQPGLRIEDVFKRVRVGVRTKTNGNQVPWESVSLEGDFYFMPTAAVAPAIEAGKPAASNSVATNPGGTAPASSGAGRQEHVKVQTYAETVNRVGIEMVRVPAGKYLMGAPASEEDRSNDEGPQHEVRVSSFYMGKYEVTQAQWQAVASLPKVRMDLKPNPAYFKGEDLPVEQVSWEDAVEFCARLSKATGKTYRLPTEAEWEYAARAMTTGPYAGDEVDEMGWYDSNSANTTHPVGRKKANGFGLYDMHGNVWEMCMDWYSENYYTQSPGTDPAGPSSGSDRVGRGGGWGNDARGLRVANRSRSAPGSRSNRDLGFRLVRTIK